MSPKNFTRLIQIDTEHLSHYIRVTSLFRRALENFCSEIVNRKPLQCDHYSERIL
jgi:hypothetical protein